MASPAEIAASLSPAQRRHLAQANTEHGLWPHGGSQRKCTYNLMDLGLVHETGPSHGCRYAATDLGRAVAAELGP